MTDRFDDFGFFGESEVDDFALALFVDDDVFEFEITMNDVFGMDVT